MGDFAQDQLDVIDAVNAIFINTDAQTWEHVRNGFADDVFLDYSSMGADASLQSADAIVTSWQEVFPGFEATQHAVSNHVVEVNADEADCFCYGTALHYLPNDEGEAVWRVVGHYDFHLVRSGPTWKAERMTFTLRFMDGNTDLPTLARQRAAQSA